MDAIALGAKKQEVTGHELLADFESLVDEFHVAAVERDEVISARLARLEAEQRATNALRVRAEAVKAAAQ